MGAWIEINIDSGDEVLVDSRTPRWVRGLKLFHQVKHGQNQGSHPTMGAWIEINRFIVYHYSLHRRTPRWVRGLKLYM